MGDHSPADQQPDQAKLEGGCGSQDRRMSLHRAIKHKSVLGKVRAKDSSISFTRLRFWQYLYLIISASFGLTLDNINFPFDRVLHK